MRVEFSSEMPVVAEQDTLEELYLLSYHREFRVDMSDYLRRTRSLKRLALGFLAGSFWLTLCQDIAGNNTHKKFQIGTVYADARDFLEGFGNVMHCKTHESFQVERVAVYQDGRNVTAAAMVGCIRLHGMEANRSMNKMAFYDTELSIEEGKSLVGYLECNCGWYESLNCSCYEDEEAKESLVTKRRGTKSARSSTRFSSSTGTGAVPVCRGRKRWLRCSRSWTISIASSSACWRTHRSCRSSAVSP